MAPESHQRPLLGRFVQVKCKDCSNIQIVFNKSSTAVNCMVCGTILASPSGGKAEIKGEIMGVLE